MGFSSRHRPVSHSITFFAGGAPESPACDLFESYKKDATKLLGAAALSPRESESLSLLAQGHRNKAIALAMDISEPTVEFHISNARKKLGTKTREQAVALAVHRGLISLADALGAARN